MSGGPSRIGLIGLGIMGSAMARNLVSAGIAVTGFDTDEDRKREAQAFGADIVDSGTAVAQAADLILTSLPNDRALTATVDAILAAPPRPGRIVAELSTLAVEAKLAEEARLAAAGVVMLDCPVSGTGAQAARRDIVLYASGDAAAYERARPAFAAFARDAVYLGAFGNGMRMKLVANLLVAIHNVAAAEAILLGLRAGLDPDTLVGVLAGGAGGSRMLEVRGPMMIREAFEPATMKLDVWRKDMSLIADFARATGVATPLFSATAPLYEKAGADGRGNADTAAVYEVLKEASATEVSG